MKNSFPTILRGSILIAALTLIIFTYTTTPYTHAQTCDWKTNFCGPQSAPTTNSINFLLRLIHSLPTTDKTCAPGEVLTGFNKNGEMICTPTSTMPGLKGPKGDRGDPAPPPINGQCGTTNNNCTEGTLNDIADTSLHYQWQCTGQNGGSDSGTCQKAKPVSPP